MDSIVVDVTDLIERPKPGDWVEVIGPNQSADAIADAAGTIGYEILTSFGHRYARTYVRPGSGV
jgi:alanine racemase